MTVLEGLMPPLEHRLYLPVGQNRLSTGHTPTSLPISPAAVYPHSADTGKSRKEKGTGEQRQDEDTAE